MQQATKAKPNPVLSEAAFLARALRRHRRVLHDPREFETSQALDVDPESRLVYMFGEGSVDSRKSQVRGNKGSGLAELVALGLPVPPGATITTEVAETLAKSGALPCGLAYELARALHLIEDQSGLVFGARERPLLLAVRSGAAVSMPGMMDTVLNVGLNPDTVAGLAARFGERFAWDTYRRFLAAFGTIAMGVKGQQFEMLLAEARRSSGVADNQGLGADALQALAHSYLCLIEQCCQMAMPADPSEQLCMAICAVLASARSERTLAYRHFDGGLVSGTAVNIQAMVFGNCVAASGTGVVFSADPSTGSEGLYGEFLPEAQGDDVVSGACTPLPLSELARHLPLAYIQLCGFVSKLVGHFGDMLDIEFTVQNGALFLLQCRAAKRTAFAAAVFAVAQVEQGKWSREQALACINGSDLELLRRPAFASQALVEAARQPGRVVLQGRPASPGCVTGELALTVEAARACFSFGRPFILARLDTTPEDLPVMLMASGVVTACGGATCHAAVVARGKGIPAAVACGFHIGDDGRGKTLLVGGKCLAEGQIVSLDGASGRLFTGCLPFEQVKPCRSLETFLAWLDERAEASPVRPLDMSWKRGRHCLNAWLNDFYLTDLMLDAARGSLLEQQARTLKNQVESDLAAMLSCYLLCCVAHEIMFFSYRHQGEADAYPSWRLLVDRFAVQMHISGSYSAISDAIIEAVGSSDLAGQAAFFRHCADIFGQVQCWDEGFGRGPWADIAQTACDYLAGVLPRPIFVDHVFDLQHHGRAMFNNDVMVCAKTCELVLHQQLAAKKEATAVGALYKALMALHCCHQTVSDLYEAGLALGLWA